MQDPFENNYPLYIALAPANYEISWSITFPFIYSDSYIMTEFNKIGLIGATGFLGAGGWHRDPRCTVK
jgi:hypothetical protein